jgi:hypothetical protein
MSGKTSAWLRIKRFFRPERETYETRQARGPEAGESPATQHYEATDQRRSGGSAAIGGV